MIKFFLLAFAFLSPAFAQVGAPHVIGPVVEGKVEGSNELAYLPFSKGAGPSAVIATEDYVKQNAGSGVPFDQSLRLVDKRPSDSSDKCRKGDLNIDELSAATYAYLCVGDNWRRIRLDLF